MGNSKNIKRHMKKEYGPRKIPLPKSLEFLSSINFHAIVEDRSSERTIRTVEIKPRALKNLIEKMDFLDQYLAEHTELVKSLKSNIRKLRADNNGLSENQKLSERLASELDSAQEKILILTKK